VYCGSLGGCFLHAEALDDANEELAGGHGQLSSSSKKGSKIISAEPAARGAYTVFGTLQTNRA
jgi:hypothetical protein